ncbi:MAG: DNA polymerase III subunit gamma/tau [Gammaproteobacteria bacterium]|nr:DNA polymerase III subunit gamma/tau [Gammaproteobacteria bacterium]
MSYQVLARKWRPRLFKDMVGQDHVLKVLVNALDSDRLHHAYLFTGTRGVGKTTLARILAKCLNCEAGVSSEPCGECGACTGIDEGRFVDLIEVDAASRAKVDETRDLMDNVQYAATAGRYKVYLIDEVHMFSKHSFNALLKTLEEPPAHVKFLLATTEPKRIPITILSRCLQFNLKHLGVEQIEAQLNKILVEEEIPAEDSCTRLIAVAADGSMRDALSLLDQAVSYGDGRLENAQLRDMLGTIDAEELGALLADIIEQDGAAMFDRINSMAELSPDYDGMLSGLLSILHDTAVAQVLPDDSDIVDETCRGFARSLDKEAVQLYYQIALNGRRDLHMAPDRKTAFEMTMIRMLAFQPWEASGAAESESGRVAGNTEPVTAGPERKGGSETRPALVSNDDWHQLVASMALDGLTKELASHCTLQEHQGHRIRLNLHPDQEHLAATNQKDKLQSALGLCFGAQTRLLVSVEEAADETPAQRKIRDDHETRQAALEAVENDPDVKLFMKTFDATIDKESIKYLGSE